MKILLIIVLLFGATFVWAQAGDREANLRSLVAAEEEFARAALEQGINASFVKFFADDSILFNPFPVNGKQFYLTSEKDPGVLTWKPIYTDVSAAGDLGYNTGPSEYSEAPGKPPIGFGYFVSMWRKGADGQWKVVLELGTRNDKSTETPPLKFAPKNNISTKKLNPERERNKLADIDAKFARILSAKKGGGDISKYISENLRMNRMRVFPSSSREELLADLRGKQGKFTSQTIALHIAQSGDLGYSYGTYEINNSRSDAQAENEKGSFLRIWRREDGKWKLVFDVQRPAPTKRKQTE